MLLHWQRICFLKSEFHKSAVLRELNYFSEVRSVQVWISIILQQQHRAEKEYLYAFCTPCCTCCCTLCCTLLYTLFYTVLHAVLYTLLYTTLCCTLYVHVVHSKWWYCSSRYNCNRMRPTNCALTTSNFMRRSSFFRVILAARFNAQTLYMYTVFFFIIYSNYEQFTWNLYQL